MARRDYAGNARPTTLTADLGPTDLTISIADLAGWPSGGGAGKFFITINRGLSNEERILVSSRTGSVLTVASLADRGVDDTTPGTHSSGSPIEHTFSSVDADEANEHINTPAVAEAQHTTLLNNARHDVEARHQFGAALGNPGLPTQIGTGLLAGTGDDPAREDHTHSIGVGAINASNMFAAAVVNNAALGPASVGTSNLGAASVTEPILADLAVTTPKLADASVTTAKIGLAAVTNANLFGSIAGAKLLDDAITQAKMADASVGTAELINLAVTMVKVAVEAPTTYVPVFGGLTGGSNTVSGSYFKFGGLVIGIAQFTIGAGGEVNNTITVSIPTACRAGGNDWFAAARMLQGVDGATGMGVIAENTQLATNFRTIGVGVWDANSPVNWTVGGTILVVFCYASAT